MLYNILYNYTKQYHFIFLLRLLGHYFVFLYFIFNFIILFLINMQLKRFPVAFSGTVSMGWSHSHPCTIGELSLAAHFLLLHALFTRPCSGHSLVQREPGRKLPRRSCSWSYQPLLFQPLGHGHCGAAGLQWRLWLHPLYFCPVVRDSTESRMKPQVRSTGEMDLFA